MLGLRRHVLNLSTLTAGLTLAACATQTITASLPKIAPVAGEPSRFEGQTADIYGLIARGAMSCWFATNGQLKKTHIFHADAESPANGGAVEIAVLERELQGPKPWGAKAFKVELAQSGEQTTINVENLKMPEPIAVQMRADVFQWAQGRRECTLKPIEVAAPPPPEAPKKTKAKVNPPAR